MDDIVTGVFSVLVHDANFEVIVHIGRLVKYDFSSSK